MPESISEYLSREPECDELLACIHGLKQLDRDVFEVLTDRDRALTVDEIADPVGRERSTAYRSVQRLLSAGLIRKEQVNYEQGGYYHVYEPADPDEIADRMQRVLNDWYAQMGQLISQFREEYGSRVGTAVTSDEQ